MHTIFRTALAIGLVTVVLGGAALHAQDWDKVLGEAQRRCEAQHAQIRDMTIVQDLVTHTEQGDLAAIQQIYQRGAQARIDMTMALPEGAGMDSMTTIVIDTGTERWMISPLAGKQQLSDSGSVLEATPHECWEFTRENSRVVGEGATPDGHPAWIVELSRDSVTHTLWLDRESLTVLEGRSQSGPDTVRWVLSDFRPVIGDYQHPYKVDMYDGGLLLSSMVVRTLSVNTGIADSVFDPSAVDPPALNMEEILRRALEGQGAEVEEDSAAPEDSLR